MDGLALALVFRVQSNQSVIPHLSLAKDGKERTINVGVMIFVGVSGWRWYALLCYAGWHGQMVGRDIVVLHMELFTS